MLPKSIFNNLTSLTTSDGLIGIFIKPKDNFNFKPSGNYVVLDRIQNPGNLGSIIRTAVGFQLDGVIISNDSVDLYNPNIIRSTMGSCFAVPIKFVTSLTDVIKQLQSHKLKIYATAISSDAKKLNEISFPKNGVAIIFGNEGNGLKDDVIKMSDETIYIPINNKIDSLNVAVAVGIVLYKLCEQL
jgi:TrmH family RNA methyltransferase